MQIQINIPRPWTLLGMMTVGVLFYTGHSISQSSANGVGGTESASLIAQSQQTIDRVRVNKEVLAQKEEILRYQLFQLEQEALRFEGSPEIVRQVNESRQVLLAVIKERDASDRLLSASLRQLWEAQGTDFTNNSPKKSFRFSWPVKPLLGLSAHFDDANYRKIFKVDHHAVDIPTRQGTTIEAPADGTVKTVAMNGLGYSYLVLTHDNGFETVYGHISEALVKEGDVVTRGTPIAKSGGRPGSPGAGLMTTGDHLHWVVRVDGVLVDPEEYVEPYEL
jgi:murein DD-endopeptidase MepM/ murein hydrolase activator NlpD